MNQAAEANILVLPLPKTSCVTSTKSLSPSPTRCPRLFILVSQPNLARELCISPVTQGRSGTLLCCLAGHCFIVKQVMFGFPQQENKEPRDCNGRIPDSWQVSQLERGGLLCEALQSFSASFLSNSWGQIPEVKGDVTDTFLHLRRGEKRRFSRFCHVDLEYRREKVYP